MTDDPAGQGWHLDKRVPVLMIAALALQLGGIVWAAAHMNADISTNARDIARLERQAEQMQSLAQVQAVQLARIEETLVGMRGDIGRLISIFEEARP